MRIFRILKEVALRALGSIVLLALALAAASTGHWIGYISAAFLASSALVGPFIDPGSKAGPTPSAEDIADGTHLRLNGKGGRNERSRDRAQILEPTLRINHGHSRRTLAMRCGVVIPEKMGVDFKFTEVDTLCRKAPDGVVSDLKLIKLPEINKSREFLVFLATGRDVATFYPGTTVPEVDAYFEKHEKLDSQLKDDLTLDLTELRDIWLQRQNIAGDGANEIDEKKDLELSKAGGHPRTDSLGRGSASI